MSTMTINKGIKIGNWMDKIITFCFCFCFFSLKFFTMARGKLILICQSGGEFVTNEDGSMSYTGGEAHAVDINRETIFNDLKLKLAEMWNLEYNSLSVKYFLPGNRRTLINLSNDKDLKRMYDFHGSSVTADVFVMGRVGFDCEALNIRSRYFCLPLFFHVV
jgi:hypothetical protein